MRARSEETEAGGERRSWRRRDARSAVLRTGVAALVIGALVAGSAVTASGSERTIHFFAKSETNDWTTAAGQPIPGTISPSNPPQPGDQLDLTDLDYVGNHLHHASGWTATDHVHCLVNSQGTTVCQGEIAIGGSMVLVAGMLGPTAKITLQVSGGTGSFQGATGTVVSVTYTPNSTDNDLTLNLDRS